MSQRGQTFRTGDGLWAYRYRNAPGLRPVRPQRGGFDTRKDARTALDAELRRLQLGTAAHVDEPLQALVDAFLEQYEAAPATVAWVKYHLDKVTERFGDVPLGRLSASSIAAWRKRLPEGSRHQTIKVLRQVLARGVAWKWVAENVAALVDNPHPRRPELEPFESWAEVIRIAEELGDFGELAIVGAGTGLRPQELFGLERRDVDLAGGVVLVRRAFAKGRLKEYGKTEGSTRRVPLRRNVAQALDVQLGRVGASPRAILFPAHEGGRVNIDNFRSRLWSPALDAAGLAVRGPYHLRHTYATWSLAAGVGIFALARRMGTSVAMIDKTYGHLAVDADDHERALLDAWDASEERPYAHAGRSLDVREESR